MAGDWLKIETVTPEKPEVLAIASTLNIHPDEAFGKCFRFWRWVDSHTVDGHAKGVTPASLDATVGCAGFAHSLVSVGWLSVRADGISVPNFDYHISKSAKERALASTRQKVKRGKDPPVTQMSRSARDKNRETSSLLSSELSSGLGVQGEGEEIGHEARASPFPGQSWGSFCATEWVFYFRGTQNSERDLEKLTPFFEALFDRHKPEVVLAGIRAAAKKDPLGKWERSPVQASWDFVKWLDAREGKVEKHESRSNNRGNVGQPHRARREDTDYNSTSKRVGGAEDASPAKAN